MQELYEYIGRITFLMVHVEFVLSYYSAQINSTPKSDYHYFADTKTSKKLEKLIAFVENQKNEIDNRENVSATLRKLVDLINERNRYIHSLILTSKDTRQFRSYRFILNEQNLIRDFQGFEISDLKTLEKEFGDIYTEISSYLKH